MDYLMLLGQQVDGAGGLVAGGMLIFMLFMFLLVLVSIVLWLWALVSAIKNPALDDTMRIVWIIIIVLTGIIGAILYAILAPKSRNKTL